MKTLKKVIGASETKSTTPILTLPSHGVNDAVKTEWLFARQKRVVVGIGDEELALGQSAAAQLKEKCLTHEQKLERLHKLLETLHDRPAAPGAPIATLPQTTSDAPGAKKE